MSPFFFRNFFRVIVCFSPVFAFLISRVKLGQKHVRMYFIVSEVFLAGLAIFLLFNGLDWLQPTVDLVIYMVFMMLFLALFTSKLGLSHFNSAVAVSILLTFVVTEAWEFAVVVYAYLGLFGRTVIPIFHPLDHIYVILCFYLALKISGFRFSKVNITLLLTGILSSFLFFPPFDIIPFQEGVGVYNPQFLVLRTITFLAFAVAFYFWSDKKLLNE